MCKTFGEECIFISLMILLHRSEIINIRVDLIHVIASIFHIKVTASIDVSLCFVWKAICDFNYQPRSFAQQGDNVLGGSVRSKVFVYVPVISVHMQIIARMWSISF